VRTWLWTIVASFGFFQLTLFPALRRRSVDRGETELEGPVPGD